LVISYKLWQPFSKTEVRILLLTCYRLQDPVYVK